MVSPQFVAETLVALERLGAQPTLNIFDGTISLAGRLPPLAAAGAPRVALEAYRNERPVGAALAGAAENRPGAFDLRVRTCGCDLW